jgi:hypothetical protein
MGRIALAFKAFFAILANKTTAERVASAFVDQPLPKVTAADTPPATPKAPSKPARSEALTLLEALQREARLIDLCQESLDQYTDEQVGAAARNVLRDSRQVFDRFFSFQPLASEGEAIELPASYDAGRYRLAGKVEQPPYRGRVTHAGWQATRCELPQWNGRSEVALVVAPAEVEIA